MDEEVDEAKESSSSTKTRWRGPSGDDPDSIGATDSPLRAAEGSNSP